MNTPFENLQAHCRADMAQVNQMIDHAMQSHHAPRIGAVSGHLIGAGGKRLRSLLCLAGARICGYDGGFHIHLATVVEFIHTATLLHDDVVDESDKRRGRESANLLWDNKSSILVGDYLFARAFQLMVQVGDLAVLDMLSSAAATIAEGEVLQLSAVQNIATDEATYLRIITGKTAALFAASCGVGAILSGAGTTSETALYNYGEALGMSFQIVDDVLDYDGNSADLGKNIGDDFREGKMTLPVIIALQRGDAGERVFWQRVMETGKQESGDFERAKELLLKYDALEETKTRARAFGTKAQESLAGLGAGSGADLRTTGTEDLVQILHDQMDFVISRIS